MGQQIQKMEHVAGRGGHPLEAVVRGVHAQGGDVGVYPNAAGATAEHHRRGVIAECDHPLEGFGDGERFTYAQLQRARIVATRLLGDRQLFTQAQAGLEYRE